MEQEDFNRQVLEQLDALSRLANKLMNTDHCLQSLCLALAAQSHLDRARLVADYEDALQLAQEQVPPHLQNRDVYQRFAAVRHSHPQHRP